jgi:hypothetical protein
VGLDERSSVELTSDAGILVNCHAGCSQESILGALGLKDGDLLPDLTVDAAKPSPQISGDIGCGSSEVIETAPGADRDGANETTAALDVGPPRPRTSSTEPVLDTDRGPLYPLLVNLFDAIGEYHLLDDRGPFAFGMAVAVSAGMEDAPLWGMLLGPPSGGKTESLKVLDLVVNEKIDNLTHPALLSFSRPKGPDEEPVAVGILPRLGRRGFATIEDFSTVLSDGDRKGRADLFAALRRIFDGEYKRDLGNQEVPLIWLGRLTILAACTPNIDDFAAHADSLGPRFLYFRLGIRKEAAQRQIMTTAFADTDPSVRRDAQLLAKRLVDEARAIAERAELSPALTNLIQDAAIVVAYGRGNVPRESGSYRDISGEPVREEPARVAKQLHMLARAAKALGLSEADVAPLVCRAAVSTMPAIRSTALRLLANEAGPIISSELARRAGSSAGVKAYKRNVEDLEALGAVVPAGDGSVQEDDPWATSGHNNRAGARDGKPWMLDPAVRPTVERVYRLAALCDARWLRT